MRTAQVRGRGPPPGLIETFSITVVPPVIENDLYSYGYEGVIGFSLPSAFRYQPPFESHTKNHHPPRFDGSSSMPPTTGAANGRLGGRLSGGVRARKSLAAAPRVRFVQPTSAPSLSSAIAGQVAVLKKRRKSAGDAPNGTPAERDVLREIAASAARAAETALAAAATAQAAADAEEPPPPPKALKHSTNSNVPPAAPLS